MTITVDDISLIFKALSFAAHKHQNQRRENKEAFPYINHPISVAEILWEIGEVHDITTIVVGILHDALEDTDTSLEELESLFGKKVCSIVEELTDADNVPEHTRKRLQVERAKSISLEARCVKLADKISNIQDIISFPPVNWSLKRQLEYVNWSGEVINGLRGSNEKLERYFDDVCRKARQKLNS